MQIPSSSSDRPAKEGEPWGLTAEQHKNRSVSFTWKEALRSPVLWLSFAVCLLAGVFDSGALLYRFEWGVDISPWLLYGLLGAFVGRLLAGVAVEAGGALRLMTPGSCAGVVVAGGFGWLAGGSTTIPVFAFFGLWVGRVGSFMWADLYQSSRPGLAKALGSWLCFSLGVALLMGLVFEKPADLGVLIQLGVLASVFACLLWAMFAKVRGGIPPHLTYFAAIHQDIRELMDEGEAVIQIGSETPEDREQKEKENKDKKSSMGLLGLSAAILINFLLALTPWLLLTLFTPLRVIAY